MQIATWNVNSIRARVGRVTQFLERTNLDVLAMQEIKCKPEQFPVEQFSALGYDVLIHGFNQWNGVAFAYKNSIAVEDVEEHFPEQPEFDGKVEARALGATFNGLRLWSLYIPNGRELDHPHYDYKLQWLDRLAAYIAETLENNPDQALALMGDFNIAPLDSDVWDINFFAGSTHVSEPERIAFEAFEQIGIQDVVRPLVPEGYTYWDYKDLRFPRNEGMRIDFVLGSQGFAERVSSASIERNERKGEGPSDHVPVLVELS